MTLTEKLKQVSGPGGWIDDPEALLPYLTEWRGVYIGRTPLMVQPRNTQEVSKIVSLCADAGAAIVPQGGNTGLCGGAIPDAGGQQILLSLSRMNAIRKVSADDFSMTVEAGCILANVQQAAAAADRFFPLSLSAEGSCQIGGNLSTNAGGTNVLRYGTARDQVLGLEVVLPDGRIWDGLRALRKDTAGYDVKQLFIGAEGTMGVITAANLKLYPMPQNLRTAFVAINGPDAAVSLISKMRDSLGDQLLAFELIPARAIRYVCRHIAGTRPPFAEDYPWYVLLESSGQKDPADFEDALLASIERGAALDAVIAKNQAEANDFWRVRHSISEAQKLEGASLKHDVSVPLNAVGHFITGAESAVLAHMPEARVVAFGHVGDGNVHFNISQPVAWTTEQFVSEREALATLVYDAVDRFDGSISAEHGIGIAKKKYLSKYRSETELAIMRSVKLAIDPQNLMNPGKVV